jgi:hypothetical protein
MSDVVFFRDGHGYNAKPVGRRQEIEVELRGLWARKMSDPDERDEIDTAIEALRAELRALDAGRASGGRP